MDEIEIRLPREVWEDIIFAIDGAESEYAVTDADHRRYERLKDAIRSALTEASRTAPS